MFVGFCRSNINADIYEQLFDTIKRKRLSIRVFWLPSHTRTDPIKAAKKPTWVSERHVLGNEHADRLAGDAASSASLEMNSISRVRRYTWLVRQIQRRIAAVITHIPHRAKLTPPIPSMPKQRTDPIINSPHDLMVPQVFPGHTSFVAEYVVAAPLIATLALSTESDAGLIMSLPIGISKAK